MADLVGAQARLAKTSALCTRTPCQTKPRLELPMGERLRGLGALVRSAQGCGRTQRLSECIGIDPARPACQDLQGLSYGGVWGYPAGSEKPDHTAIWPCAVGRGK